MSQASQPAYAAPFLRVVQEALKLGDQPVRRAVIDIDCTGVVMVYLERFVKNEELDLLGPLLLEIPSVNPGIEWVDRIAVEAGNGASVVVKRLQQADSPIREAVKSIVHFLQHASPEQQKKLHELIQEG